MHLLARLCAPFVCVILLATPALASPGDAIAAGPLRARNISYEFAIYYLDAPAAEPLAALRQLLQKSKGGPVLVDQLAQQPATPQLKAIWVTDVQKSYAPPSLQSLQYFGRGLSPDQERALQRATRAVRLDFAHKSETGMRAYRDSVQLTEDLARATQGLIWDEETRLIFTPDEWHRSLVASWDGDIPQVRKHTSIHLYPGEHLMRAISLGMEKFGLPDVVVDDFPKSSANQMGNIINALTQRWVEGFAPTRAGEADLALSAIQHRPEREAVRKTLKEGGTGLARLQLVEGRWEDGDPRNRLIEIRFDRYEGPDVHARQEAMIQTLFGSKDAISYVKHNQELEAASRAAVAKLPQLRDRFRRGLKPGELILVKAPFKTAQDGTEWMWVEVATWEGNEITGTLQNNPFNVPTLHAGQTVKVRQSDLFDYIHRDASGKEEGNTTGAIIGKMEEDKR